MGKLLDDSRTSLLHAITFYQMHLLDSQTIISLNLYETNLPCWYALWVHVMLFSFNVECQGMHLNLLQNI